MLIPMGLNTLSEVVSSSPGGVAVLSNTVISWTSISQTLSQWTSSSLTLNVTSQPDMSYEILTCWLFDYNMSLSREYNTGFDR